MRAFGHERDNRESDSPGRFSTVVPEGLSGLSPKVHAFRMVLTDSGKRWDRFDIFDSADQGHVDIRFTVPAGRRSLKRLAP